MSMILFFPSLLTIPLKLHRTSGFRLHAGEDQLRVRAREAAATVPGSQSRQNSDHGDGGFGPRHPLRQYRQEEMDQQFRAFAAVVMCWVTWAYEMSFGDKLLPFWGDAGPALG
ncbi:ammonium transporter [Sarracenia purpurea var. burkii]